MGYLYRDRQLHLLPYVWKCFMTGWNISDVILTTDFQEGQTALHQAAQAGHQETVQALVLGGCDVGIQDFVSFY